MEQFGTSSSSAATTAQLRKRSNKVASSTVVSVVADATSNPPSQLPSPLSSVDENMRNDIGEDDDDEFVPPRNTIPRRKSSAKSIRRARSISNVQGPSSSSTADRLDIPLAVALIPPLGSFLTGGDFLRDFLLFLLLFFYLHQLIKIPWELYLASRPRGKRAVKSDATPEKEHLYTLIESELKTAELSYLTLAVLAPLLGAALLRYVGTTLTGKDYISWFSTGVFVLVTGIRPWRHLGRRLRSRTEELQETILSFRPEVEDMPNKIARLEEEIARLKKDLATKEEIIRLNKEMEDTFEALDTAVGKCERIIEVERRATEERFAMLEKQMVEALKNANGKSPIWNFSSPGSFFSWLHSQTLSTPKSRNSPSLRHRASFRPRLQAVTEEDDGTARAKSPVVLNSRPRLRRKNSLFGRYMDLLLLPFSYGRTLLWGIVDFVQRSLI